MINVCDNDGIICHARMKAGTVQRLTKYTHQYHYYYNDNNENFLASIQCQRIIIRTSKYTYVAH